MSSLVKQMCSLKCRINVDSLNGNISISDMDDENVESVIDSIDEAFNIIAVDIVPTVVIPEPEPPVVTEDSIKFEELEFNNAEVREQANKLLRIIFWAMYSNNAKPQDICQFLMSAGSEIAMKYNPKTATDVSIGDIVDCNYGSHIKGEISGGHVHSVVCDIDDDGMVYILPITKAIREGDETRFLTFTAGLDAEYTDIRFTGGTILLKMGRYVHQQRFGEVVGHVLPEFFSKILTALSTTLNSFTKNDNYDDNSAEKYGDVENDDNMLSFEDIKEESETPQDKEESSAKEADITSDAGPLNKSIEATSDKVSSDKDGKKIPVEEYISNIVSEALNSLDSSVSVEDQVEGFLDAVGISKDEIIIKKAFIAACVVKKIGYESIITELSNYFPKLKEEIIKSTLKTEFKKWLEKHPDVKENYPKVSIMVLLKIFAKKMA